MKLTVKYCPNENDTYVAVVHGWRARVIYWLSGIQLL